MSQRATKRWLSYVLALFLALACFSAFRFYSVHIPQSQVASDQRIIYDEDTATNEPHKTFPPLRAGRLETNSNYTTTIVVGRLNAQPESVAWINESLNVTDSAIYIVDDPLAKLHLKKNRGRESMVYIKYILDHYDNLNDITFFFHAHAEAWHNNLLLRHDSASTINMMKHNYVMQEGFVNTRCDLSPGCPTWIKFNPTKNEHNSNAVRLADMFTSETWTKLFPDVEEEPRYISAPCCSQFAVSRDTIHNVPRATFQRLHDWLSGDPLDQYTGRFMEYSWHYIFTGKGELCPQISQCYCEMYGICVEDDGMMDKWQQYRNRATELNGELIFLDNKLKKDDPEFHVDDDEEHADILKKMRFARKKEKEYEDIIKEKYAIPPLPSYDGKHWDMVEEE